MSTIDFEDINLPAQVADQPAEGIEVTPADPEQKKEPETPPNDQTPIVDPPKEEPKIEDPQKEDEPKSSVEETPKNNPEPASDPQKPEGKLTPFHEHPDWKKMQEENKELQLKIARLEGRADVTPQPQQETDPYAHMTPNQAALAMVRKEADEGKFKPKDQAEVTARVMELTENIKQNRFEQQEKRENQIREQVTKEIDTVFSELQVTDETIKEKVMGQVKAWMKEGMTGVSPKTLKLAYDYLNSKGELTTNKPVDPKPADPTPQDDPAKNDPGNQGGQPQGGEDKTKKSANSRIAKPKGGGDGKPQGPTIQIKGARNKSLDQLVIEAGQQLDGGAL